jgi:hypothetical protein
MRFNYVTLLQSIILFNTTLVLQEATPSKDRNLTVHSFLNTALIYKCKGNFYNAVPITRIEDNNIKLLWLTMVILIIGLTMLFNNYIIPTELILRLLHRFKSDIGGILLWLKREPKREILLKTIKQSSNSRRSSFRERFPLEHEEI